MDNTKAAISDYNVALKYVPNDAEVFTKLANAYASLGDSAEAVHFAGEAARLSPGNIIKQRSYAISLNEAGEKDAARAQMKVCLKIDPNHAQSLHILATMDQAGPGDAEFKLLSDLLSGSATTDEDKVHLGFGLGKIYEDIGEYETAFSYLKLANDTNFALLNYDPRDDDNRFAKIKATYTKQALQDFSGSGNQTKMPILVVGLMRSGTSLVEQILSSHSDVLGAGELMAATKTLEKVTIDPGEIDPAEVAKFSEGYLHELEKRAAGHPRVTDKMPANFAHIGLMKLAFPNIKIVNLVRDPRDTCYSIYKTFFDTPAHQYAYNLEYLARFSNHYKGLMQHWHEVFPGQVHDCRYEDLIADQEATSRKLLEYCDLEWQPQVLDFHKTKRAVRTASVNQVRQKIYKSSVRSWERVEKGLRPLIDNLDPELWSDYL